MMVQDRTRIQLNLIEAALPLDDINREAAREKSFRHRHPTETEDRPTRRLAYATRGLAGSRRRRSGLVWRGGASGGAANEAVRRSAATGP